MSGGKRALEQRRAALLQRSEELREDLTHLATDIGVRLRHVETSTSLLRRHGGWLLAGGATLLLLFRGPRRLLTTAGRITLLWPIVRPWLPRLAGWLRGGARD